MYYEENVIRTPGGILLGILEEVNEVTVFKVKRGGRYEICDIEYIKDQFNKTVKIK